MREGANCATPMDSIHHQVTNESESSDDESTIDLTDHHVIDDEEYVWPAYDSDDEYPCYKLRIANGASGDCHVCQFSW